MRKHYFSKRRRSRSRRRTRRRRSSKRRSRRKRSRKSKRCRKGNKLHLANGKVLKIRKDAAGNEYVVSGKSRSKKYVGKTGKPVKKKKMSRRRKKSSKRRRKSKSKRRRRKSSSKRRRRKRSFGKMPGLVNIMGNYRPPNKMNTFQQYTGMSAPQMMKHMDNVLKSDRANFYTSV